MTDGERTLRGTPANLVGGAWRELGAQGSAGGGSVVASCNPAHPERVIFAGTPRSGDVEDAVRAAREALPAWRAMGVEGRTRVLRRFQELARAHERELALLLRDEVGKPSWDALAEAQLLASKVDITLDEKNPHAARGRVRDWEVALSPTRTGRCVFRGHGVMAVVGPFNFPLHLPNGHIVPALLLGNTVVFKPSDKGPACGQALATLLDRALRECGAPAGVVNLVHGAGDVASALTSHEGIDGVLFTGSWPVGRRIMQANLDRPGRILALEMGGSNAAIVMPDADIRQAVVECVRSAFVGAGQRCTCTRRLIVHEAVAQRVIPAVCKAASGLIIADPAAEHPVFMGPLVTLAAREHALREAAALSRAGGEVLVPMAALESVPGCERGAFVTPGVVRVERFDTRPLRADGSPASAGADVEVFAPFLRVCVVASLEEAIEQANATAFGLAASIFTRDERAIDAFVEGARAGCVNVNTGTAGASSLLPFGGLGLSGNHRPAGAFSVDYCAYPVGCMIERGSAATMPPGMRVEDAWLA